MVSLLKLTQLKATSNEQVKTTVLYLTRLLLASVQMAWGPPIQSCFWIISWIIFCHDLKLWKSILNCYFKFGYLYKVVFTYWLHHVFFFPLPKYYYGQTVLELNDGNIKINTTSSFSKSVTFDNSYYTVIVLFLLLR